MRRIMDNHSGPQRTPSQPPPPPTVVQHRTVIVPDVSSLTTEAPPAMLNLDDNYSSSDEAYIEPARSITAGHSAKWHKKTLEKPIQNLTDLCKLPPFDPLQPVVPPHKVWNRLPISFSELDAITPIQVFNLFLINSIMGQLVANTNSYAQQQLLGPEKEWQRSWQPVTAQDHYLWLGIQIHMGLIGDPPERYWMKDGFTFPRMDYHQLPTLARLAYRRSAASLMFLHTLPQLKLLKFYLVGIQRWIFYWSSCSFSHSSTEYLAAMLLLMKP